MRKSFLFVIITAGLIIGFPGHTEETVQVEPSGPTKSTTIKPYKKTNFQQKAKQSSSTKPAAPKSVLKTYRRGDFQEQSVEGRSAMEKPRKTTLDPYRRGTFQEDLEDGTRTPDSQPASSVTRSYRGGENVSEKEIIALRREKNREKTEKIRDAMEAMGHTQLVERLDGIIKKDDSYYDRKLRRVGEEDPTETPAKEPVNEQLPVEPLPQLEKSVSPSTDPEAATATNLPLASPVLPLPTPALNAE